MAQVLATPHPLGPAVRSVATGNLSALGGGTTAPEAVASGLGAIAAAATDAAAFTETYRLLLSLPSVAGAAVLLRDGHGRFDLAAAARPAPLPAERLATAISALAVTGTARRQAIEWLPDLLVVPLTRDGRVIGALALAGHDEVPAAAPLERLAVEAAALTLRQTLECLISHRWLERSVSREEHEQALAVARRLLAGALRGTEPGYLLDDAGPADVVRAAAAGSECGSDATATLTQRDRTFLWLLAAGCSNRQIAHELGCADSTVRNGLSHLFDKLGVEDRTQAVLCAMANGVVPGPVACIREAPARWPRVDRP